MKVKFWSSKNTKEGFLILLSSIVGGLASIVFFWAARWLILWGGNTVALVFGVLLALLTLIWDIHVTGWFRRWLGKKG